MRFSNAGKFHDRSNKQMAADILSPVACKLVRASCISLRRKSAGVCSYKRISCLHPNRVGELQRRDADDAPDPAEFRNGRMGCCQCISVALAYGQVKDKRLQTPNTMAENQPVANGCVPMMMEVAGRTLTEAAGPNPLILRSI